MEKPVAISVIIACYNQGEYIEEMLESVFSQTFTDFEVIIVNDGSTDNTRKLLDRIRHPKLTVIHSGNHGPSHARNLAIAHASAEIIMNLDADDKIAPTLFEKACQVFADNPNAGIVYADVEFFGAKSGIFELDYSLRNMLYENRIISQAFFRREDWQITGGYCEQLRHGLEDWDFWLSILELKREPVKIPEVLIYYRVYNDWRKSRSGRLIESRGKQMDTWLTIFHRHQELFASYPEDWEKFAAHAQRIENETFLIRLLKDLYYKISRRISTHE
ncbi:MAG: glycosyltransferase family A protein [Victivallales bacterium]